jgi:hypothetical protein
MLTYTPDPEISSLINTNNISPSSVWYDTIYNNLRYCNSNKINDMLNVVGGYYYHSSQEKSNAFYYPTLLLSKALESSSEIPYISGASGRVSQDMYNSARANNSSLASLLSTCGFEPPRRRAGTGTKCIHFVFVSSGFSLVRNFINANHNIERNTVYENLINNYRKNNITHDDDASQTIVVNNVYAATAAMQDNITIITNKIPDKEAMHYILLMIQAHYAGALITSAVTQAAIETAIKTNEATGTFLLQDKIKYYLTEFWERELQRNVTNSSETNEAIHNIQTDCLNKATLLYLKSLVAEAPMIFLRNLSDRYNYDYRAKDEQALSRCENDLENYYNNIRELEHKRHTLQRRLAVLKEMDTEEIQEFWDAITLYKNICVESTANTALMLRIISPLTFYDEEDAKTVLNNPNSSALITIRNICEETGTNYDITKAVLFDIFINKKYQIHTYTRFKLSIGSQGSSDVLYLQRDTSMGTRIMYDKLWQPHIMRFDCYSAARTNFHKEILNKQFDVAFGQLVGATQNLTVSDNTVFSHLLTQLINNHRSVPTLYDINKQQYISFDMLYDRKEEEIKALQSSEEIEEHVVTVPEMKPISELVDAELDF